MEVNTVQKLLSSSMNGSKDESPLRLEHQEYQWHGLLALEL